MFNIKSILAFSAEKQTIIEKLKAFFEKYFGIGKSQIGFEPEAMPEDMIYYSDKIEETDNLLAAEPTTEFNPQIEQE